RSPVQPGEHRAAADLQAPPVELVAQLRRVLRHEAGGSQLGPDVPGLRELVEVLRPGHLVGVLGEPHAPGVRGGAQPKPGQGGWCGHPDTSCGLGAGVRSGRWFALLASYVLRACWVLSRSATSETGTSHQPCEEGTGASGSVSMCTAVMRSA